MSLLLFGLLLVLVGAFCGYSAGLLAAAWVDGRFVNVDDIRVLPHLLTWIAKGAVALAARPDDADDDLSTGVDTFDRPDDDRPPERPLALLTDREPVGPPCAPEFLHPPFRRGARAA